MNEMRTMLEQSVSRLFADRLDWDALSAIEESGFPEGLWEQVIDQGIHLVLAGESDGGMEAGWGDAYAVIRACGRYAVPLPVAEIMLASHLLRKAGAALPAGVAGLISDHPVIDGEQLVLDACHVPWGSRADYLLAAFDDEIVIADNNGFDCTSNSNIGLDPRDVLSGKTAIRNRYSFDGAREELHFLGALARSAQIAGGGAAALDLAVQYASEREQFGRPLSKFQAIQHHLADLAGVVASVDAISLAACEAYDQRGIRGSDRNAQFEIAAAKCRASEGVEKITRLSHQVHGAIGFTYEYGLHFVTRRLWSWRAEFGTASEWGRYLGEVAAGQGGDGIWPWITA